MTKHRDRYAVGWYFNDTPGEVFFARGGRRFASEEEAANAAREANTKLGLVSMTYAVVDVLTDTIIGTTDGMHLQETNYARSSK